MSEREELAQMISEDAAFLHGLQHGWNLGVLNANETFNQTVNSRCNELREARKELRGLSQTTPSTERT